MILESAGEKAEVHDARWRGETQAVSRYQPLVAVRALHELVTEPGAPLLSVRCCLRESVQVKAPRVLATNCDSKSVVEAKRMAEGQVGPALIFGFDAIVNRFSIRPGGFLQYGRECGAGVFGIDVNASGENALVRDVSAAQIETTLDRELRFVLDLLRDEFAEDDLLGEVFATDDNAGMRRAGGKQHQ